MHENIREGFDVFLHDGDKGVGAVRQVRKHELVVYIENAGDFEVPFDAIKDAEAGKVILDSGKLDPKLKAAISRAHTGEDPRIP
jgi:hypothetical protein